MDDVVCLEMIKMLYLCKWHSWLMNPPQILISSINPTLMNIITLIWIKLHIALDLELDGMLIWRAFLLQPYIHTLLHFYVVYFMSFNTSCTYWNQPLIVICNSSISHLRIVILHYIWMPLNLTTHYYIVHKYNQHKNIDVG